MRPIDADGFIEDIKTEAMNLYMDGMKGTPRPHRELFDIIDRIEEQPTIEVPRWIPVTERLPEKGGEYLCNCCIDGHKEYPFFMVLRYYIVDKNPHFQHECEHGMKVTHWMPVPTLPKDGE